MGYGRYFGPNQIELVDTEARLFFGRQQAPPLLHNVDNQQHVRAIAIQIEPIRDVAA